MTTPSVDVRVCSVSIIYGFCWYHKTHDGWCVHVIVVDLLFIYSSHWSVLASPYLSKCSRGMILNTLCVLDNRLQNYLRIYLINLRCALFEKSKYTVFNK